MQHEVDSSYVSGESGQGDLSRAATRKFWIDSKPELLRAYALGEMLDRQLGNA